MKVFLHPILDDLKLFLGEENFLCIGQQTILIGTIHIELYISEDGIQETSLDYGSVYLQC